MSAGSAIPNAATDRLDAETLASMVSTQVSTIGLWTQRDNGVDCLVRNILLDESVREILLDARTKLAGVIEQVRGDGL